MSDELEENSTMSPRHFVGNWPYVINMANSIIGVSVLALPFCFKECGILLGLFLLMGSAWLTQLTCHLLMKSAFATKKRSYEYLAFHIFGQAGKLLVELSIIGLLIGTCIAFYIIIGDLGPAVVSKVTGLENTSQLRSVLLVVLTALIVLPLAMLHSLDSLSNFSAISLTFYCIFVVEVVVAAFPNLWSGIWMTKVVFWNMEGMFKCLPIFALSFACQTQLFIMSDTLPEPSVNRVNRIVHSAVVMCSVVYVAVGFFGYVAFCDDYISGDILMNFRPTFFSEAIKLGFMMSTLISFPLVIFPCRASLYTLLFVRKGVHENFGGTVYIPSFYFKLITVCIIGVTLTIGILVPNIEFMLAITGATMGSLICYILPAILFMTAIHVDSGNAKTFAQMVLLIGVMILLASSYVTLAGQDKVVKHESLVKVGQPIVHNEDDQLNIDEIKRILPDGKDASLPVDFKNDRIRPDGGGLQDLDAAMNSVTVKSAGLKEVMGVSAANVTVAADHVADFVVKRDNSKEIKKENDKRQEPPNPHAPLEEVIVAIEEKENEAKKIDNITRHMTTPDASKEEQLKDRSVVLPDNQLNGVPDKNMESKEQRAQYDKSALAEVLQPKVLDSNPGNESLVRKGREAGDGKQVNLPLDSAGKKMSENDKQSKDDEQKVPLVEPEKNKSLPESNDLEKTPPDVQLKPQRDPESVAVEGHANQRQDPDKELSTAAAAAVGDNKHNDADHREAKAIIEELKKQQREQRLLLDEHHKIIDELKRHQRDVHTEKAFPAQVSKELAFDHDSKKDFVKDSPEQLNIKVVNEVPSEDIRPKKDNAGSNISSSDAHVKGGVVGDLRHEANDQEYKPKVMNSHKGDKIVKVKETDSSLRPPMHEENQAKPDQNKPESDKLNPDASHLVIKNERKISPPVKAPHL